MPVNERTYSFRAEGDLADRTQRAFETWLALLTDRGSSDSGWREETSQQLWLTFTRHYLRASRDVGDSHSARLRAITEIFVTTAERVAEDRAYIDEYRAWAKDDDEGPRWREGTLEAAADRWRDD